MIDLATIKARLSAGEYGGIDAQLYATEDISDLVAEIERMSIPLSEDTGLSIDMLDVDRLRDWARNILTHGHDISEWGSVPFVAGKMQIMATDMEKAIRDIGVLRSARADLLARARNYLENGGFFNPEMMEHEKVRDLIIAMAAELNWTL